MPIRLHCSSCIVACVLTFVQYFLNNTEAILFSLETDCPIIGGLIHSRIVCSRSRVLCREVNSFITLFTYIRLRFDCGSFLAVLKQY